MKNEYFIRFGRIFCVVAVSMTIFIMVSYKMGSNLFNAHQSLLDSGGIQFKRLGGLVGEAGSFAFNTLIICQMAFIFFVMTEQSRLVKVSVVLLILVLFYYNLTMSYARVVILSFVIFFVYVFFTRAVSIWAKMLLVFFGAFFVIVALGYIDIDRFLRSYRLTDFMTGDFSRFSSSRGRHWEVIMNFLGDNPVYAVFGVGHRMVMSITGVNAENFFVQHLVEYGVVGSVIYMIFLLTMVGPLYRASKAGDLVAVGFMATWIASFGQWQFNDINTFYQTFPVLLFFTAWKVSIIRSQSTLARDVPARRYSAQSVPA